MRKSSYNFHNQSLANITTETFADISLSYVLPKKSSLTVKLLIETVCWYSSSQNVSGKDSPSLAKIDTVSVYDYKQSPPRSSIQLLTGLCRFY